MFLYKAMDLPFSSLLGRVEQTQPPNTSTAAFSGPGSHSSFGGLSHHPGLTSKKQPSGPFFTRFHSHRLVLLPEDSPGDWPLQELISSSANVRGLRGHGPYYMQYTTQDMLDVTCDMSHIVAYIFVIYYKEHTQYM